MFVNFLDPRPGEYLLELGSGSGVLSRMVGSKLVPNGKLMGLELSSEIVSLANDYLQENNLKQIITYDIGDALSLPYEQDQFDGAFAARLLLHVPNPQKVVKETKRVVKPGGRVVLMDWDFGTLAIDHTNRALTRTILDWRTDHKDGNNWSGRQLYRILTSEGFEKITIKPAVMAATDENNSLTNSLFHAASGALDKEIITQIEYDTWIKELKERLNTGQFFACITYILVKGICP